MMETIGDFHVHTKWCGHAQGEMGEYVARACEVGLPAVGFSAHFPAQMPHTHKVCLEPEEVPLYIDEAKRLKDIFKEQIDILIGFEADYAQGREEYIEKECIRKWNPDYVTGAIHLIDEWPFDHPDYRDGYANWRISDLYRTYFARLERLAETGLFDIVAHVDLVKKFGYRPEENVSDSFEHLLDVIAGKEMLIEANTAGFDKPVGEMYPSFDILKAACSRDIGVVLGSDAHAPKEVGRYFGEALKLLGEAGYGSVRQSGRLSFYKAG